MRLFRICTGAEPASIHESLCSHYELGREPRRDEARAAVVHMAVSMWADLDVARQVARMFPRIGNHIAVVDLIPGRGVCVARTGPAGHWSVWGRPVELVTMVADVVSI